jgi:hypothetical protein
VAGASEENEEIPPAFFPQVDDPNPGAFELREEGAFLVEDGDGYVASAAMKPFGELDQLALGSADLERPRKQQDRNSVRRHQALVSALHRNRKEQLLWTFHI